MFLSKIKRVFKKIARSDVKINLFDVSIIFLKKNVVVLINKTVFISYVTQNSSINNTETSFREFIKRVETQTKRDFK